jgi:hypothetical protein
MIESFKQSIEEFKRVDHLYYVTLKYTRTVDVIRSVIERIISTFEYAIDAVLKCMKEEKIITEIPTNPVGKALLLKEKYEDAELHRYMNLYLKLRKLLREDYTKREEYRRHVTMGVVLEGEQLNIDIDLLKEYYDEVKKFLSYVKTRVEIYKDD